MLEVLARSAPPSNVRPCEPKAMFNDRVLQVFHSSSTFNPNGYAARSEQILASLDAAGINQRAITRLGYPWDMLAHRELPKEASSSNSAGWRYQHTPLPASGEVSLEASESDYLVAYAKWIESQAVTHGASVIHAHSNYLNGLAAIQAAQRLDVLCVYEMRGLWHVTRASREPAYATTEHFRFCERRELEAAARAHRVVALTKELAEWLVDHGIDGGKVTVVPNAAAALMPVDASADLRVKGRPTIGFVGSFVDYEGLDLLVEATAHLIQSQPNLKVILVGDGPCAEALKRQISQRGLEAIFELPGRVGAESVGDYYRQFDVGVVPRQSTAITELVSSLKPMELMAYGIPCVATNLGPIASMVTDREHLMLTPANDAVALAAALGVLLEDSALRQRLRAGGLEWATNNGWARNAQVYRELYG